MKSYIISFLLICYSFSANSQVLPEISFKSGPTLSGQIKTPEHFGDKGTILGLSVSIEPTLIKFGSKKQFDLNVDLSFIQKGGVNYNPVNNYNNDGTIAGTGSESYNVQINYLSLAPLLKVNFGKIFFLKTGPRVDVFTRYKSKAKLSPTNKTDFNIATVGITYGAGICCGQKQAKFICEILGQNDFTASAYNNLSHQTYSNYSVLLNIGVVYLFRKEK